ncbi:MULTISPECIES: hypothetical protein [Bacillaceae]|uniref:hypothetical protein n=1 Tax=Bacillaceae TaxID=186817 RepID=UPI001BDF18EE|nr:MULTISPECIES: hypothetical protein [Bacillaceae]MDX8361931.1 hypothetical protein [Cytobacillus sp. IB215316]
MSKNKKMYIYEVMSKKKSGDKKLESDQIRYQRKIILEEAKDYGENGKNYDFR